MDKNITYWGKKDIFDSFYISFNTTVACSLHSVRQLWQFEKAQLKPSPLRYSWEILLPSLGLIKHVHDVINLLYYKHWTGKWKYIPCISVTHKVLKSCRSKMATLAHDVCDVHGASSLYIKSRWQSLYKVFRTGGWGNPHTNQKFAHSPPPHGIFITSHQKPILKK